jgi:beta-glucosidase
MHTGVVHTASRDLALMHFRRLFRVLAFLFGILACVFSGTAIGGSQADAVQLKCRRFAEAALPKPVPQINREAIERFQLINREANARSYAVLFLGDSITQKWDHSLWDRYFVPMDALNAGVNGDRTENLLWRIEHGNLDQQRPEIAVLLIGTNDIGQNRPPRIIAESVREILGVLRSQMPATRILLLGVLPRSESPGSERRRQVSEVNQLIRTCADGERVFYTDIGGALLDRAGRLTREVSPDGVHLSERGYSLLTDRLRLEVGKMLPVQ